MRRESAHRRRACLEPERWTASDDQATETAVTAWIAALVTMLKPDRVIETGSYRGQTARAIGAALAAEGRGALVTCEIDPARVGLTAAAVAGLPVTVWSGAAVLYAPDGPVDLVFADSDFRSRGPEIRHFARWASPRAVVVLHDTYPAPWPGMDALQAEMRALVADQVVTPWTLFETPRGVGVARYVTGET
jgi:predicted O-methyltransferase YrrM